MILFYAAENSRVVESLKSLLAVWPVKRCRSIQALVSSLRKPCHGIKIGLLVVGSSEEMFQIMGHQDLIRDLRLVLVLPERDPRMVVMAHKLAPRFIAYADNGYEQIGAVLGRMIDALRQKRNGELFPLLPKNHEGKGIELKG